MHRVNYTLLLIVLFFFTLVPANEILVAQTTEVQLAEVQIVGSRKSLSTTGLHTLRIDSLLKTKYFGTDLSRILKEETNLNITQYGGEGSLASIRLRGSAPSQTQINWNGIPVNSPTTGSIDLSLLSGGMADAIEIAYGAGGTLFGSGTFGGSINLFNSPEWNNRLSVNLTGETGSWNHLRTGLGLRAGNESLQYQLSALYQSSPNNYTYHNHFKPGNPLEYRLNDSLSMMAVQQHLFFRLPNNWQVQYGIWWHDREKQLPSSESSAPSFAATQKDQSIRQFVRATKKYRKTSIEAVAAFFTDSLFYGEKQNGSDAFSKYSGIRSYDTYLSLYHRWYISDKLTLENGADFEYQSAQVEAYNSLAGESRSAIFSLLKYRINHLTANMSYRQVFYSMTGPKPLFAASFQYQPVGNGFSIKGQVSNKFRFPTLNDRYWKPGGNPDLLPESGMGYDFGAEWYVEPSVHSAISIGSMLFLQNIDNWIQWVPVGTYWSPQNVKQVKCQGFEFDLTGKRSIGSLDLLFKGMYSYTESLDMTLKNPDSRFNRQLSYVPFHLLRLQGTAEFHQCTFSIAYKYSGQRFTSDDHDPWLSLDPYHLADLSLGYTFLMKKTKLVLSGRIANLFNSDYQLIRAYPAPGRAFYLSVNYLFNDKTSPNVKN